MRLIVTNEVAWSVGLSVGLSRLWAMKNGSTDRDAVWDVDSSAGRIYWGWSRLLVNISCCHFWDTAYRRAVKIHTDRRVLWWNMVLHIILLHKQLRISEIATTGPLSHSQTDGVMLSKHVLHEVAHWRNLANTIQPFVCGDDAALCQITSTTC